MTTGQTVKVLSAHTSDYPNPISFEAGDQLVLGRRDTEFVGWIRVTTADGNEGWAPEQFLNILSERRAVASRVYTASELDTSVGELLVVLDELNEWLWVKNSANEFGWVPKHTVSKGTA